MLLLLVALKIQNSNKNCICSSSQDICTEEFDTYSVMLIMIIMLHTTTEMHCNRDGQGISWEYW